MDTNVTDAGSGSDWQEDVFRILKDHAVKHVAYVPDAGHSTAIRMAEADEEVHSVVLTTEEEGIGYLAGAWLGGERGALADAVQRRRQLHQHAGAADVLALPAPDGRDHAGRLGGVQRVAEPDGPGDGGER